MTNQIIEALSSQKPYNELFNQFKKFDKSIGFSELEQGVVYVSEFFRPSYPKDKVCSFLYTRINGDKIAQELIEVDAANMDFNSVVKIVESAINDLFKTVKNA